VGNNGLMLNACSCTSVGENQCGVMHGAQYAEYM